MKILIVGFQRSGTTLLRNIMENHPDVQKMFHERFFLKHSSGQQKNMLAGLKNPEGIWGEKVPYFERRIKRGVGLHVEQYCKRWFKIFKSEARVLHIIRHPWDVGLSNQKTFNVPFETTMKTYADVVPKIVEFLLSYDNCIQLKFEWLVQNQHEAIETIYKFCKLRTSQKIISSTINKRNYRLGRTKGTTGIVKERAFVYQQEKFNHTKKLFKTLDVLNTIQGPKYEVKN